MKGLKIFEIERKPHKGLLTCEWVVLAYTVLTLFLILFTYTKMPHPEELIWGRARIVAMTAALWGVYRMVPCRLTLLARTCLQLVLLGLWYPETYEFNKLFPNLDHLFAAYEQHIFSCQPALLFSQAINTPVFSELMYLGYASYYPLIGVVTLFYFFFRYAEFNRAAFVILTAFFLYYVIFIFLPVTGPQYYYLAAGMENIAHGIFPNVRDYFLTHDEMLTMPGYGDGFFYHFIESAHEAGERPTAAFPSSHVGIGTVLMLLAWRTRSRLLFYTLLPLYVLMCFATVYIRAHYAIDVIAGWVSAVVFYVVLQTYWTASKRQY